MDLDFNKVNYDDDLADFSEDELRELVRKFESAQESNVAEFKTAAEALEGVDETDIEDFTEARGNLIESITEAEAFSEVPLSEDALEEQSFGELRDWKEFVSDFGSDEESEEEDEQEFDSMGKEAPTHEETDEDAEFAEKYLDISGVNFD